MFAELLSLVWNKDNKNRTQLPRSFSSLFLDVGLSLRSENLQGRQGAMFCASRRVTRIFTWIVLVAYVLSKAVRVESKQPSFHKSHSELRLPVEFFRTENFTSTLFATGQLASVGFDVGFDEEQRGITINFKKGDRKLASFWNFRLATLSSCTQDDLLGSLKTSGFTSVNCSVVDQREEVSLSRYFSLVALESQNSNFYLKLVTSKRWWEVSGFHLVGCGPNLSHVFLFLISFFL